MEKKESEREKVILELQKEIELFRIQILRSQKTIPIDEF
jgi:hypothetical protein